MRPAPVSSAVGGQTRRGDERAIPGRAGWLPVSGVFFWNLKAMAKNGNAGGLTWLVLLLVVGGGAGAGWWYWKRPVVETTQYFTKPVTRGDLLQAVTATGQLNPVLNVQVGSQISGMVQKLFADFNSQVKAGQVIAQIDPATYLANVHQAEGELASAKAALELAQINARRAKELRASSLVSASDFDKTTADLHQAEAAVIIREAVLEKTKVDLARCTIVAPVDGIIISRNVDVGQTVAASLSAPTIFVIANDLTKMQIDANVAEADVGGVEAGQEVDFTVDAYPTRSFRGKVVQVRNAPLTVQNVVTYDTVIEVSNPDMKLKPGMTANVSIITARRENVLKFPNAALRFRPAETADANKAGGPPGGSANAGRPGGRGRGERSPTRTVYTLASTNSTAPVSVQVKAGISDGVFTEAVEGLNEDALVITGQNSSSAAGAAKPANPFGGGGGGQRRF